MPGPVLQARIFANTSSLSATTRSWTLPLWILEHKTICGDKDAILHPRIAKQLGVTNGDVLVVEIAAFQTALRLSVEIVSTTQADLTINGLIRQKNISRLITSIRESGGNYELTNSSGIKLTIPDQKLFSNAYVVNRRSKAILFFSGGCRNNPHGPAGYGYLITLDSGEELIAGYGFNSGKKSSNFLQFAGLIEGLIWALRLDLSDLEIRGDSKQIVKQAMGEYRVTNPLLKASYMQVKSLMQSSEGKDVTITSQVISRGNNSASETLANMGMDRMENKTCVIWNNVNNTIDRS